MLQRASIASAGTSWRTPRDRTISGRRSNLRSRRSSPSPCRARSCTRSDRNGPDDATLFRSELFVFHFEFALGARHDARPALRTRRRRIRESGAHAAPTRVTPSERYQSASYPSWSAPLVGHVRGPSPWKRDRPPISRPTRQARRRAREAGESRVCSYPASPPSQPLLRLARPRWMPRSCARPTHHQVTREACLESTSPP